MHSRQTQTPAHHSTPIQSTPHNSGSFLCRCPLLSHDYDELGVVGHHDLVLSSSNTKIPQLVFWIQVADHPPGLRCQTNHAARKLFRILLRHGGETTKHLPLLVANHIILHACLHLDALYRLLDFALLWWERRDGEVRDGQALVGADKGRGRRSIQQGGSQRGRWMSSVQQAEAGGGAGPGEISQRLRLRLPPRRAPHSNAQRSIERQCPRKYQGKANPYHFACRGPLSVNFLVSQ